MLKHGSLFSGIGGFELAAQWAGWENVFHCEINPFGQKVLNYYWPNSISYHDIKTTDFTIHRGSIDILTGGFPCQPYSAAGKRLGTEDERHLWPEMLRAIREISPRWIVGENVSGLVSWNGGLVFNEVQSDLEAEGYEVQPILLPASSLNAPHKRERIYFIAHSNSAGQQQGHKEMESRTSKQSNGLCIQRYDTNPNSNRLQGGGQSVNREKTERQTKQLHAPDRGYRWQNFPSQPPICSGDDGFSIDLDRITFSKWRTESIKAYGNAIVPQVVYQIFKSINHYEFTI